MRPAALPLQPADALLVVDVQEDFVRGSLAVPGAPGILPAIAECVRAFEASGLPVIASRDWHPAGHASFRSRGGPWPPHCIAGTPGAAFAPELALGPEALVVSKATGPDTDAYSAFAHTALDIALRRRHVRRLFVCGLATDYCVLHSVLDALRLGYAVFLIVDAVRAVNVRPGDEAGAIESMAKAGAVPIRVEDIVPEAVHG